MGRKRLDLSLYTRPKVTSSAQKVVAKINEKPYHAKVITNTPKTAKREDLDIHMDYQSMSYEIRHYKEWKFDPFKYGEFQLRHMTKAVSEALILVEQLSKNTSRPLAPEKFMVKDFVNLRPHKTVRDGFEYNEIIRVKARPAYQEEWHYKGFVERIHMRQLYASEDYFAEVYTQDLFEEGLLVVE